MLLIPTTVYLTSRDLDSGFLYILRRVFSRLEYLRGVYYVSNFLRDDMLWFASGAQNAGYSHDVSSAGLYQVKLI